MIDEVSFSNEIYSDIKCFQRVICVLFLDFQEIINSDNTSSTSIGTLFRDIPGHFGTCARQLTTCARPRRETSIHGLWSGTMAPCDGYEVVIHAMHRTAGVRTELEEDASGHRSILRVFKY